LLFTDIAGSTALLHQLGDSYGDLLDEHDRLLRGIWAECGGVEVDNEGDAFFVVFTDHHQAVTAATSVIHRCAETTWPGEAELLVRMALHSGEPRVRGRHYWGVDVNYAARLCSASHGGQAILSASMRQRIADVPVQSLGEHGVKDFPAPRELFHLVVDGRAADSFPAPRTLSTVRANIPSIASPIVGRDVEISEITDQLRAEDGNRIITLVGPGGVGKTRLAVACAEALTGDFTHGVAFAALATAADTEAAASLIADALDTPRSSAGDPIDAVIDHLRDQRALLVLDNAEHLPGLGAALARLVESTDRVKILVTSQASLGVRSEVVRRLDPLAAEPAVEMFVERVRSRHADFSVTPGNASAVRRLCAVLDGMPLALELASARTPVLGVDELLLALERDPDALGAGPHDLPARQRGTRAALDWTVSLLSPRDRDLFLSLGAFASAWTLGQVEELVREELSALETWDALTRLADLSLVVPRGDGRFTMAERVRRGAVELLVASGREHELRRRHAELMAAAMDWATTHAWLDILRVLANTADAMPEVQHALAWASRYDVELHRRLVAMSAVPLAQLGRLPLIIADIERLAPDAEQGDRTDGYLHLAQAMIHGIGLQDMDAGSRSARAAVDCLRQHGGPADPLVAMVVLVEDYLFGGNHEAARPVLAEAWQLVDEQSGPGWTYVGEGLQLRLAIESKDLVEAQRLAERIADAPERTDWFAGLRETWFADIAFLDGRFDDAVENYARMMTRLPAAHFDNVLAQIQGIAAAFAGLGRDEDAHELLTGIAQVYRARTASTFAYFLEEYEPVVDVSRGRLDEAARQGATTRGERVNYEALVQRAAELARAD